MRPLSSRHSLPGARAVISCRQHLQTFCIAHHDTPSLPAVPGAGASRRLQLLRLRVRFIGTLRLRRSLTAQNHSFIVLGILVSYLPQHYKIISRRSSRGLSPLFVLLGTVSGTASIANILTLPESTRDMACCREIAKFPCAAAMLGVAQIGVQWSCFFFMCVCFLHDSANRRNR